MLDYFEGAVEVSGHLPIHIFRRLPACFCDDMKIFNHILVPPPKLQFGIHKCVLGYWQA